MSSPRGFSFIPKRCHDEICNPKFKGQELIGACRGWLPSMTELMLFNVADSRPMLVQDMHNTAADTLPPRHGASGNML